MAAKQGSTRKRDSDKRMGVSTGRKPSLQQERPDLGDLQQDLANSSRAIRDFQVARLE